MSYPTIYDVSYSYSGFQASLGDGSFPGTQLDADMAGLSDSVASINAFIQVAFRSDGVLKAASLPGTDPILQYVDEAAAAAAASATEIASAAATSASASATAAAGSASSAATSETQAATSASAAQTARTGAETAQTAAAASAAASAAAAAVFDPSAYLSKSGNLAGLTDKAAARANLALATVAASGSYGDLAGRPALGSAAAKDFGTAANNLVALDEAGKLPAVPGDQLTGLPFKKAFESGEITIVAAGTFSVTHDLAAMPTLIMAVLVCKTASNGWSVGDEIPVCLDPSSGEARGVAFAARGTTTIVGIFGSATSPLWILNPSTGAREALTSTANFKLKLRAWL